MISQSLFEGEQVRFSALDPEKDAEVLSRWTNTPGFCARNLDGLFRQYTVSELKKKYKEKIKKADETMRSYYFALRENEGRSNGGASSIWMDITHPSVCTDMS